MIRKATEEDVETIKALIDHYSKKKIMLSRTKANIINNLQEFFVFEEAKEIIACVALHAYEGQIYEVRSFAVKEGMCGKGFGKQLLEHIMQKAKANGTKHLFTLTLKPEFFEKAGFERVDKYNLSHKIWNDCINCPKYNNACDEIALEIWLA